MAREFKHGFFFKPEDMPDSPIPFEGVDTVAPECGGDLLAGKGERVYVGSALSDEDGFIYRSPVSGTVKEIISAGEKNRIVIESDKAYTPDPEALPFGVRTGRKITDLTFEDAVCFVRSSGIVEGGTGEPTYKLMTRYGGRTDKLVINCARDFPGDFSEAAYALFSPEKLIGGMKILMIALGIKKGTAALSSVDRSGASELFKLTAKDKMVQVEVVSSKYPQSEPHMLIYALSGRELSPLREVERAGYAIFSAKSAVAVYEAFATGIAPGTHYLSVSDESGSELISVPVGIPLSYIRKEYNITSPSKLENLWSGREMKEDEVIPAGADQILFYRKKEYNNNFGCNKCGECVAVCPMYLFPYEFAWSGAVHAKKAGVLACMECGLCEYVCPSEIALAEHIRTLKNAINTENERSAKEDGSDGQ